MSQPDIAAESTTPTAPRAGARWLAAGLIVAAVFAAYLNSFHAPFIFDDAGAITNNPTIRDLRSLDVLIPPADGTATTGRPLVNASFALNYAVSGEQVWSYHALNVGLHALAALTLFGLGRRTLAALEIQASTTVAFAAAALWSLHPLQTESVTCVAQRTELLCGLFYMLTLYFFARGIETSPARRRWLTLSAAACLAGMACKEVMVTAPLLVLLYDRTFVGRSFSGALRQRRAYYAALAGTWLLLAWLVLRGGGSRGAAAGFGLGVSWWTYLLKQCDALVIYLTLSVWPHPLVLDYGDTVIQSIADVWWQGLIVLALLAATIWALVRKPVAGFVGAWFFVILAPSSSIVPLVGQTIAEHRLYLPLAALVVAAILAVHRRCGVASPWLLTAVALGFGGVTIARNHDYRDRVVIWADTSAKRPLNARAHEEYALALFHDGRAEESLAPYGEAIRLQPAYPVAHSNLAMAFSRLGRLDEAITHCEEAIRLKPTLAEPHVMLGHLLAARKQWPEAITHYEIGLRLKPQLVEARVPLANALMLVGRPADAIEHYELALRAGASDLALHNNLGMAFLRCARPAEAVAQFEAALRLEPGNAQATANLATATQALTSLAEPNLPRKE